MSWKQIFNSKKGFVIMLSELDLHITNRCTTQCTYCCFSSNRLNLPELSTAKIKDVMDQALELGCKHIHFTGGEPLLRTDIPELISYASSLGFEIRMQTNGSLLTDVVAQKLVNAGLTSIMISLDSAIESIHDKNRGKGTWNNAIKAINVAQKYFTKVRVNSVLTEINKNSMLNTIRFVKSLGVSDFSAFYFSPIGSGKASRDIWIEPQSYIAFWNELNEAIKSNPDLTEMNIVIEKAYATWDEASSIDITGFTGCGGGCLNTYNNRDYLIVRCDGNVYPCIMAIDSSPLGNINFQTLKDIHKNSPVWDNLLPIRENMCADTCEHYGLCGGGCRYYPTPKNAAMDQRCIYNKLVPLCPIMKYNYKNDSLGGSSDDVMV